MAEAKAHSFISPFGTTEVVPCYKTSENDSSDCLTLVVRDRAGAEEEDVDHAAGALGPVWGGGGGGEADDELYQDAVRVVCEMGRASTSTLQRRLRIGYGRAAHLIDLMEKDGIVGPPDGTRPREVLKGKSWMKEFDESMQ